METEHRVQELQASSSETLHPYLMLPGYQNNLACQRFLNISTNKVHLQNLPEVDGKECCGSSEGWLFMLNTTPSSAICLLNPITRAQIKLPQIEETGNKHHSYSGHSLTFHWKKLLRLFEAKPLPFIHKIILSKNPSCTSKDYVVMAIHGEFRKLAFYKPEYRIWIPIQDSKFYHDIIYYKGKFCAVTELGGVVVCYIGPSPHITEVALGWTFKGDKMYLVQVAGKLILVVRYVRENAECVYRTTHFDVFELDLMRQERYEVEDLGEWALFLGQNQSISISVPDLSGYRGNRIYFTDDFLEGYQDGVLGGHDLGVFNLENRCIEPLQCSLSNPQLIWPPPIWFMHDSS